MEGAMQSASLFFKLEGHAPLNQAVKTHNFFRDPKTLP